LGISVEAVDSRKSLREYMELPYRLYRNHPVWVPPLRMEERRKYEARTNPMLLHCTVRHFLAHRDGEPVGRVSAFVDRMAVEHWKENVGLFGSYECVDDPLPAESLLRAAESWLREQGMTRMRGPWSFASQEWGLVVKGFDTPPMIMAPYNFPHAVVHLENNGYSKAKDLLVYELEGSDHYILPERFLRVTDRIARENGVVIRPLDMKRLEADVKTIVDIANVSTRENWGYVPVTDEEAHDMARSLKSIVDPDLVMIGEAGGRPIGYLIALPDINVLIRSFQGRLFPFHIFQMLAGLKKIRSYRVWALGVIPEYRRKAIDTLFYRKLYEVLGPRKPLRVEANYVLEDNMAMNNPILKMGFRHVKTYRVYEKKL